MSKKTHKFPAFCTDKSSKSYECYLQENISMEIKKKICETDTLSALHFHNLLIQMGNKSC
jgi:hypothetical protein